MEKENNNRCSTCNRYISNLNWHEGKVYGEDCLMTLLGIDHPRFNNGKTVAERKAEQAEKDAKREASMQAGLAKWKVEQNKISYPYAYALKNKNMSRIKSEFKIKFIASLINQFDEKGYITDRQIQTLRGTGEWNGSFYDNGMLNDTDRENMDKAEELAIA